MRSIRNSSATNRVFSITFPETPFSLFLAEMPTIRRRMAGTGAFGQWDQPPSGKPLSAFWDGSFLQGSDFRGHFSARQLRRYEHGRRDKCGRHPETANQSSELKNYTGKQGSE